MAEPSPELDVIFHQALAIIDPSKRDAFLESQCGENRELKKQLMDLIRSHERAGDFLERPIATPQWSEWVASSKDSDLRRNASMEAGLSPVFREDRTILLNQSGMSVLKSLGRTSNLPRVMLRDGAENIDDPIIRPASSEMPDKHPDSRYRLDGEIARGGMGAILKGRDVDLGRELAIKVLLETHKDKPEVVQRFIEEAQIGGQLQHPGIAPVYELGQFADQRPYFSMKLVKGETLSKLLADRESLDQERGRFLGIFEQVCQTMAYAHSRGVIHRDLKPANIMVGAFGEVQVMDWGLAKVLQAGGVADERKAHQQQLDQSVIQTLRTGAGSDASGSVGSYGSQTQAGSVMGTPAYMPPEQALGEIDALNERADVFGLGAILSELLTGKPPYVSADNHKVFRMAASGKLDDCFARLDACGAEEELIQIAKSCLEPEPTARPRDAGELSHRISNYIASVETRLRETEVERAAASARAEEAIYRAQSERRARRMQLSLAAALLTMTTLGGAAGIWSAIVQTKLKDQAVVAQQEAQTERARAIELAAREQSLAAEAIASQRREESLRLEAEDREAVIQKTLYAAEMNLAGQAAEQSTGARRVEQIISKWAPDGKRTDHRGWEWGYLDSRQHSEDLAFKHPGGVCIAWSHDGERLFSGGRDSFIRIFDTTTGMQVGNLLGHTKTIHDLRLSPDGRFLASCSSDKTVRIWDLTSEALCAPIIQRPAEVDAICWSIDGKHLAVKGGSALAIYNWLDGENIASYPITYQDSRSVDWHPSQDAIAVNNSVLNATTGEANWSHAGYHVNWMPDGSLLAISREKDIYILDERTGEALVKLSGHEQPISGISWNPRFPVLASCSNDFTVRIWDPDESEPVATLRGHNDWLMDCEWSLDGKRLASVSNEGQIKIWRWPYRTNPNSIDVGLYNPSDMVWDPDGARIGIFAGHLYQLDHVNWQLLPTTNLMRSDLESNYAPEGCWNPRKHLIATHSNMETILVDDRDGKRLQSFPDQPGVLAHSIAMNPDGSKLAITYFDNVTGSDLGFLRVYDVSTGAMDFETKKDRDIAGCISWSPDGKRIATGRWEHAAIIDASNGNVLSKALSTSDQGFFFSIAWSPDGERLALAHWKHLVRIVDARSGTQTGTLVGHTGAVQGVHWSPDGSRIATCSDDKTVRIWDASSGVQMIVLKNHDSPVQCVAWSPSGIELASVDAEGRASIWSASASYARYGSAALLTQLSQRIEADPTRIEDRRLRLSINERFNNSAAAEEDRAYLIKAIEGTLESQPDDLEASYELATLLTHVQYDLHPDTPPATLVTNTALKRSINQHEFSGPEALVAAHILAGNWKKISSVLVRLSKNPTASKSMSARALTALSLMRQGDTLASQEIANGLLHDLETEPSGRVLPSVISITAELTGTSEAQLKALYERSSFQREIARLTTAIETSPDSSDFVQSRAWMYARAGRWAESAKDQIRLIHWYPSSRIAWAVPTSSLALSGDTEEYIKHCRDMLRHFKDSQEADVADSVCKSCLLMPAAIPLSDLPINILGAGIDDPRWAHYRPWFIACRALFDYRSGDFQRARSWSGDENLETAQPGVLLRLVHAMAEAKLGNRYVAAKILESVETAIPRDIQDLGGIGNQVNALASPDSIGHDWLVAELIRREASNLIRGKSTWTDNENSQSKSP